MKGDPENISVLECISLCVLVVAYDSGTRRAREMLAILQVSFNVHQLSISDLLYSISFCFCFHIGNIPLLLT